MILKITDRENEIEHQYFEGDFIIIRHRDDKMQYVCTTRKTEIYAGHAETCELFNNEGIRIDFQGKK